jgi:hypothetical protein
MDATQKEGCVSMIILAHNSGETLKIPEPLSDWIAKNGKNSLFSQNIFEKPLSLAQIRHDYFGMSSRTNIRQPGKPATERLSIEAKGELYDNEGRRSQKSS